LARAIYDVADRRFRAGDLAVLDVNLARAALARARAERDAGEADQATTLGALRGLLRVDGPIAVRGDLALGAPPEVSALSQLIEQRPELRVLEAAIREADADSAVARTLAKPNYGVGLRYQREGDDHIVLGGLTVSLPLFSKGQELGATGTARGARLRAELDATRAVMRIDLQSAVAAYERRVTAARGLETDALPGLDDTEALTARSFDAGQIGLPDVLLIRRELLDTRFQYLSALFEAALARVAVDAAAGVVR
jgi:cobalt-zinc-cadmium efflux system outer membrane protein